MVEERAPPISAHDTCANCYFSDIGPDNLLHCHRMTPAVAIGSKYWWPTVDPNDWCAYGFYNNLYYTPDGAKP